MAISSRNPPAPRQPGAHRAERMSRQEEQLAIRKRREQAARLIAEKERRRQRARTDEQLLDQERLREAMLRAGLEKSEPD